MELKDYCKKWRTENKDRVKKYNIKYYQKNKEKYYQTGYCETCGKEYADIKQHKNTKKHKRKEEQHINEVVSKIVNNAEMMAKVLNLLNASTQ